MKTINLILATLFFSTLSLAQNETISGILTDANNEAVERAYVIVVDAHDNTFVSGAITDENGKYEIDLTEQGQFILKADHISFESPRAIGMLNNGPADCDYEILNYKPLLNIAALETSGIEEISITMK